VFVNVIYGNVSYILDRILLIIKTIYSAYTVQAALHQAAEYCFHRLGFNRVLAVRGCVKKPGWIEWCTYGHIILPNYLESIFSAENNKPPEGRGLLGAL